MEMGTKGKIASISTEGEIYICPTCGYKDGFHVSFKMKEEGRAEVFLICPNCSSRFQSGWHVQFTGDPI